MENVLQKELEREQAQLISNANSTSWLKYIGLQRSSIEEKHREQCVKELEKVLLSRRQIDQSMKKNQSVKMKIFDKENVFVFSFGQVSIKMNLQQ